jgi:tetratricopeptide (TPR) repeat protein
VLTTQTQMTAPGDPSTVPILFNLALIAQRRHQYQEAEGLLRQGLAIYVKRPHSVPPAKEADTWRALAQALIAQRRFPEATAAVQEAAAIDRQIPGLSKLLLAGDYLEFARVDSGMGHLQSALEEIDAALDGLGKPLPPASQSDLGDIVIEKSKILIRLGRTADARALLTPLVAELRRSGSEYIDRDRLARALTEFGRAQAGSGGTSAALASWNEALALQQAIQPPDPEQINELQGLIAKTHPG